MVNELGSFVDLVPALLWSWLPDGRIEYLNQRWCDYTGRSHLASDAWAAVIHPDDLSEWLDRRGSMSASGEPWEMEVRLRRADGEYRWFLCRASPEFGDSHEIIRWCGISTDIDDRHRAESELRAIETNFTGWAESFPGLMVTMSVTGQVELFSREVLEFFGKTREELRDWALTDAVHPDDLPRVVAAFTESVTTGKPYSIEHRCRRADGVYRWFQVRALAVRDQTGAITGWYVVLTDIDDVKRAEHAIRASEQSLTLIINTIPALAWSAARDGRVDFFNQHYLKYVGLSLEQAKGWGWASAVHPDDLNGLVGVWQRVLASDTSGEAEARLRRHDGAYRWFLIRVDPLRDDSGTTIKWYGVNTDIDDRKAAEEALNRARSELAHVARITTVNALTASIAHEVNQPLAGIIMNTAACLRMLTADPPNVDGARETVRRTIRDGNRAADVVTRLRALFSKKAFSLEPMDLSDATREVITLLSSDLQQNRVALQAELADGLPAIVGDRVQLQQVILNLLRNALDAMTDVEDRARQLVVQTERADGDHVRLMVRDTGVGLDKESAEHLFDAFYTTKTDGMGIGLSVSRSIIESHHGRIWATPNDGPGATFAFSIPCEPRASLR